MFEANENPGYDQLVKDATQLVAKWLDNDWYKASGQAESEKAQAQA